MRIVDLKTFRSLPEGVVFMKFRPNVFGELSIKGETWEYDFLYADLTKNILCEGYSEKFEILHKAESDQSLSVKLDFDCYSRDGCFEDDQLFAVYEQSDIDGLIGSLKKCKGVE